jgi:ABC-type polysaccharide/polyol phosphate export permease
MNKKLNTAIFILVATVGNLIMMLVLFAAVAIPVILIFRGNPQAAQILLVLSFFGALVASFFLYGLIMKKISAKYNLDQYLHPIFRKKGQGGPS